MLRPVSLLVLALLACRTPLERTVLESPTALDGFPARTLERGLFAEASYVTNLEEVFGLDLAAYRVLPVALRMGTEAGAGPVSLAPDGAPARLYLEDGVVLERVRPEESGIRSLDVLDRMRALELREGPLDAWERSRHRFLYFRVRPPVRVHGVHALSRSGGVWRELELEGSLLRIGVRDAAGARPLQLGLEAQRWPAGRPPS